MLPLLASLVMPTRRGGKMQKNVRAWSCFHRMYLQADLTYEVTEERGYCVTRLRSVKFLECPLSKIAVSS